MEPSPFEHGNLAPKFNPDRFAQTEKKVFKIPEQDEIDRSGRKPFEHGAPAFNPDRIQDTASAKEVLTGEAEIKKLETFFKSGDLNRISDFLNNEKSRDDVFKDRSEKLENDLREKLAAAKMTRKDWDVLTAINLFDHETFAHSLGTFELAKKKIEDRIGDLGHDIENENVKLDEFYRSCLFHDIGKMLIPDFIPNNKTTDDEWVFHFMELPSERRKEILSGKGLEIPEDILSNNAKVAKYFYENRIRAVKLVPISSVLNEDKRAVLEKRGIDSDQTLTEIMQQHEKKSEDILKALGYGIEATLAGHHHNYKYNDPQYGKKPVSLSTLHISIEIVSSIVHLADVQQALSHDRPYHLKQPKLRILAFLVDDAEKGVIDKKVTAKWINDELKTMDPAYLKEVSELSAKHQFHEIILERKKELDLIMEFLNDNLPEEVSYNEQYRLAS